MNSYARYTTVDYAVGWFVLGAIALSLLALFQVGRVQRWLTPGERLTIMLPEEGSHGLRGGGEVVMLGARAGSVLSVDIRDIGNMTATVELRPSFARFVTTDSEVLIRKTFGVVGDAYLEIRPGEAQPIEYTGATRLRARTAAGPEEELTEVLEDVRTTVLPTLERLRDGVDSAAVLLADLNEEEGEFRTSVREVKTLLSRVREGEGVVGRLVSDPALADAFGSTVDEVRAVSEELRPLAERLQEVLDDAKRVADQTNAIAGDLRDATGRAPQMTEELSGLVEELRATTQRAQTLMEKTERVAESTNETAQLAPGAMLQFEQTLWRIEQAAEALERSWLLGGGGAEGTDPEPALAPEEVAP